MTSAIDPTQPPDGAAYTAPLRANFAAAKSEIEALQGLTAGSAAAYTIVATNDGSANTAAAFTAAQAQTKHVWIPKGIYRIDSNITLSVPLLFMGAQLKPNNGVVVTINSPMHALAEQIFDLSLGGTIAGVPDTEKVLINWWGAVPLTTFTTLTVTASAGASTITVASTALFTNGAKIAIQQNTGEIFWTTVNGTPSGSVITLLATLPIVSNSGNIVYPDSPDCSTAINQTIAFCNGSHKPKIGMAPGRYKILSQINKTASFYCPAIEAPGGGSASPSVVVGTIWDASQSTMAVDGNGNSAPIYKIKGGSGQLSQGGVKGISFLGNGNTVAVQIADQCGVILENLRVAECRDAFELFNESTAGGGGFTEWNKIRDSHSIHFSRHGVCFRTASGATNSFHGCEITSSWFNLPSFDETASVINIGANSTEWYNGKIDIRVFFGGGLSAPQHVFTFDSGTVKPVSISGTITTEGGGGWGRLAESITNTVYCHGGVMAKGGIRFGNFYLVDRFLSLGPEAGASNGLNMPALRPWSRADIYANTTPRTTLSADEASGQTVLSVVSITNWISGANVGVKLDTGTIHWTTISGTPSGGTITLAAALPSAAASGSLVLPDLGIAVGTGVFAADVFLRFYASNYEYRIRGTFMLDGFGGAGRFTVIDTWALNNGAGYGAPTFTVDAAFSSIRCHNTAWPYNTVRVAIWITPMANAPTAYGIWATTHD